MYKKKQPIRKEKKRVGKDFACFLRLVKRCAASKSVRMILVGNAGEEILVEIGTDGAISISGRAVDDSQARDFVAQNPAEFERLFLEAMRSRDPDLHIMPDLYLAKLTDMSGTYGKSAVIKIYDGSRTREFKIERYGVDGRFYLDGVEMLRETVVTYIEAHYGEFLVGMKAAMKDMRKSKYDLSRYQNSSYTERKKPHSEIVDGKLQVDIEGYLPQKKAPKEHEMTKALKYMNPPKRGHVEEGK